MPLTPFRDTTPIFAAAPGIVHRVGTYRDGNHWVELRHPVEDVGDYLTMYLHLQNDSIWQAMRAREGQPVQAGERIGTARLGSEDVVRHPMVAAIVNAYERADAAQSDRRA